MSEGFINEWQVTEYWHSPDGALAGTLRQTRAVTRLADGSLRIAQRCAPQDGSLAALAEFSGEWVFDLRADGPKRHYLGPDVVGRGIAYGDCIVGRGVWPRYGHNFVSFSVLLSPDRQLTGGRFYHAHALAANICGVAVPGRLSQHPALAGAEEPAALAARWEGTSQVYDAGGLLLAERTCHRIYHPRGFESWHEGAARPFVVSWTTHNGREIVSGSGAGVSRRYGPMRDTTLVTQGGQHLEIMDVLDAQTGMLVSLVQIYEHLQPVQLEIVRLHYL
jgi:hypothetical protein